LISSDWWAWFSDAVDGAPSSANAPGALLANILSYFQWLGSTCENYELHPLRLELQPGTLNQGASLERAVPIDSHVDDGSSLADGEGCWDDESVDLDWDKRRVSDADVAKCASYELDGEPCA